jgi:hypothetical protein
MKKLLCAFSVLMMALVLTGCPDDPDKSKQKLEVPTAPSL